MSGEVDIGWPYEPEMMRELAPLRGSIPAAFAQALREAHDRVGFACNAHDEGQACCVDFLLDDMSKRVRW